jgi:hypothetical protein
VHPRKLSSLRDIPAPGQFNDGRERNKPVKNIQLSPLMRVTRFGLIAVLAVTASLTFAQSQNQPAMPPAIKMDNLHVGNGAGVAKNDGVLPPSSYIGWYYVHPAYCKLFYSSGYPYLYIYTAEGYYFYTTTGAFQTEVEPACQTGNWLAFYVYDYNFDWSQIQTYTYK